jgi:hypothetical protein
MITNIPQGNHARLFQKYGPLIKYETMGKQNYLTNDPAIATAAFQESAFFSKHITPEHPLVYQSRSAYLNVANA